MLLLLVWENDYIFKFSIFCYVMLVMVDVLVIELVMVNKFQVKGKLCCIKLVFDSYCGGVDW